MPVEAFDILRLNGGVYLVIPLRQIAGTDVLESDGELRKHLQKRGLSAVKAEDTLSFLKMADIGEITILIPSADGKSS
jgi:hypothetical protein